MTGPRAALRPQTLEEAERARRLDCTNARACLTVAERARWPSFACGNGCYQAPDEAQRVRDLGGLLMIGARTSGYRRRRRARARG
jgi:hypothetical protein